MSEDDLEPPPESRSGECGAVSPEGLVCRLRVRHDGDHEDWSQT